MPSFRKLAISFYESLNARTEKQKKKPLSWNQIHRNGQDDFFNYLTSSPYYRTQTFCNFLYYCKERGLGFALYQSENEKLVILAFRSRTVFGAENKYHSSKSNIFGIVMDILQPLVLPKHFNICTLIWTVILRRISKLHVS